MAREIRMLDVMFKDPNNTFKAGSYVEGRVYLDLNQELKLKGMKLLLHGVARVNWDENKSYTKGSASKLSHKNIGLCLDSTCFIINRGATTTLSPGRHDWAFSEPIPAFCPGSFEGHWGRVQYFSKLVIERGFGKADVEFVKNFTVQGVLDLNTEDEAKLPAQNSCESMVGFACCKSGPLGGRIQLERRGFVPAENLPFILDLDNSSSKKVSVRVILSQQVTYRADKQTKKNTTLIKGITRGEVGPGETLQMEDEIKNIPPIPPSRLGGGCKNIDVKYFLTLVAVPSGPGKDLEVPLEIIIGTVPFRKVESSTPKLTVKAAAKASDDNTLGEVKIQKPKPSPRPVRK